MQRYWVIVAIVLAVTAWGCWRIESLLMFRESSLDVTSLQHVSRAEILARAAIDAHSNVWLLNRHAIESRIDAIPYVASAHLSIRPPAALHLDVTERAVDGCVRDRAGDAYTIDADRRVLETDCSPAAGRIYDLGMPLVVNAGTYLQTPELIELIADGHALDARGAAYRSFGHDAFGDLVATLPNGIQVKFGADADLDRKERLVGPILAQVGNEGRHVRLVDLRAAQTPVVEFRAPMAPGPHPTVHPHPVNKL